MQSFRYYCFVLELKWKDPSGGSFPQALQKIYTLSVSSGSRRLGLGEGFQFTGSYICQIMGNNESPQLRALWGHLHQFQALPSAQLLWFIADEILWSNVAKGDPDMRLFYHSNKFMFRDSFKPVFLILHPLPNTIKAWINYKWGKQRDILLHRDAKSS